VLPKGRITFAYAVSSRRTIACALAGQALVHSTGVWMAGATAERSMGRNPRRHLFCSFRCVSQHLVNSMTSIDDCCQTQRLTQRGKGRAHVAYKEGSLSKNRKTSFLDMPQRGGGSFHLPGILVKKRRPHYCNASRSSCARCRIQSTSSAKILIAPARPACS
jgi:hypothetical protein